MEPETFNLFGHNIRGVTLDGEVWFVARDVATLLGYKDPRRAVLHTAQLRFQWAPIKDSTGRTRILKVITPGGALILIARCQLPRGIELQQSLQYPSRMAILSDV